MAMGDGVDPVQAEATPPGRERLGRDWSDEDKVRYLYERNWSVNAICRRAKVTPDKAKAIIEAVDEEMIARVRDSPERVKAAHVGYLEMVALEASRAYQRSVKKSSSGIGNPRLLRVGVEAKSQIRKIYGFDAPARQVNLNVTGKTLVHPADQQAFLDADPDVRSKLLDLNAQRRALALRRPRDGPGDGDGRRGLGDAHQPAGPALAPGPAPGGDQQVADEGHDRGDPPVDHRGPPAPWED